MKTPYLLITFDFPTNLWIIALLILVMLLICTIVLLFSKLFKLQDEVEKNISHRKNKNSANIVPISQNVNLTEINERLKNLEIRFTTKPEVARITPPAPPDAEKKYEFNLTVPQKPLVEEFYMSTPNLGGYFEIEQKTDVFRPTISLYKFRVDVKDSSKAYFEFFSDESGIKDALSNPKRYIEPVCYEENDAFNGAKKIVIQQEGIAIKNGDKWMVDKNHKAKIKYQ